MFREPDRCPADPEEVAERYSLSRLTRADAVAFEDHFLTCPRCASIVETADQYTRAMKIAAQRLRPAPDGSEGKTQAAGGE